MILLGTDIEKKGRFQKLLSNAPFMTGVFTDAEMEYIGASSERAAGIYCAKEAAAKAFKEGFWGLKPRDIEVLHEEGGAPYIKLSGGAADKYGGFTLTLSVTHDEDTAFAAVIAYKLP